MKNTKKEIKLITERIKIVEDQIKNLKKIKPLFFQKQKLIKYNNRINTLEELKEKLYKELEYEMNNSSY